MLGGLKLILGKFPLFIDPEDRRLPALLRRIREAQAAVSTDLSGQVLGALHELLRGLHAAEPEALAAERSAHLYEGLLTVLMRLVFKRVKDWLFALNAERAAEEAALGISQRPATTRPQRRWTGSTWFRFSGEGCLCEHTTNRLRPTGRLLSPFASDGLSASVRQVGAAGDSCADAARVKSPSHRRGGDRRQNAVPQR